MRPGAPEAVSSPTSDRLDPGLNSDIRSGQSLAEIETFIQREKWPEVVGGLQSLIEGNLGRGDTFSHSRGVGWTSLERLAEQRVRSLPPAGRQLYERVYGQTAADLLNQARREGDIGRVADVARRFLNTPAGREAALELALLYLDCSKPLAAVRWFERASINGELSASPVVKLKHAWALRQSGEAAAAESLIERLTKSAPQLRAPDGSNTELLAWWKSLPPPSSPVDILEDWRMLQGSPARSGVVSAQAPLLLQNWSLPMTYVPLVRRQIEHLTSDLRDVGRACLPATFPLVVGERVAVRTWRGVEVLDLRIGSVLWSEAFDPASPERLLSSTTDDRGVGDRSEQLRLMNQLQYGDSGDYDQHPLTGLLFHDTVSGMLSSDGRQLFVLSEQPVLGRGIQRGWWNQEAADPFGRDWSSNRITAHDLATGAERWMTGGARLDEPFDLPLAGTYFFGPPTPVDNELYVIGERDNEVCLYVLDSELGRPLWTQPLANSSARIDVDATRRQWGCQPAIAEGVVVCPTTVGWLVAVDRLEQRLLWAAQIAPSPDEAQRTQFGGAAVQRLEPLNTRWAMTAPIISGDRVLYAPQELPDLTRGQDPYLVCLELSTGRELWRIAKEADGLYLAGATADVAIVVGRSRVEAVSLEDGRKLWTATLPLETHPSGRGVIAGNQFHLPLDDGGLWTIDIEDHRVTETLHLPPDELPLGNLVLCQGQLLSVDSLSVRSFHKRSVLEAEIAHRLAENPRDLWALIRKAELAQTQGDREGAVRILLDAGKTLPDAAVDAELVEEHRELLSDLLMSLVSEDLTARDEEYELLQQLSNPGSEAEALRRLSIERLLAREEWSAAWQALWPSPTDKGGEVILPSEHLRMPSLAWEAGRLETLYTAAPPGLTATIDAAFSSTIADAIAAETPPRTLEDLLAWHPAGWRLTAHLALQAQEQQDFAGAEIRWRRLLNVPHLPTSVRAGARLARWLEQRGLPRDASGLTAQLHIRLANLPPEQRAELEAMLPEATEKGSAPLPDWSDVTFEAVPIGRRGRDESLQDVPLHPGDSPFYEATRFEFLPPSQRLRITSHQNEVYWSLPLRTPARALFDQTVGVRTEGLQAYAIWQGVVHALSLPDRKVRWTYPIELRASNGTYVRNARHEIDSVLLPASQFASQWGLRRFSTPTGMLASASAETLLIHGRREISRLDPLTGEVRWTRGGIPPQTMVYADGEAVYVLPLDGRWPLVLRASDGRELKRPVVGEHFNRAIAIRQGRMIVAEPKRALFGLLGANLQLQSIDVATGEVSWTLQVPGQTHLGWLSPGRIVAVRAEGTVSTIDLDSGQESILGELPAESLRAHENIQLAVDAQHIFLFINRPQQRFVNYLSGPWARADGTIACFSRHGGGLLWNQSMGDYQLLLSQFRQSPVLVFVQQLNQEPSFQVKIEMWDKATGRKLLEADDLMTPAPLYQSELDLGNRKLQFLTHNMGIEVRPRRQSDAPTDLRNEPASGQTRSTEAPPGDSTDASDSPQK